MKNSQFLFLSFAFVLSTASAYVPTSKIDLLKTNVYPSEIIEDIRLEKGQFLLADTLDLQDVISEIVYGGVCQVVNKKDASVSQTLVFSYNEVDGSIKLDSMRCRVSEDLSRIDCAGFMESYNASIDIIQNSGVIKTAEAEKTKQPILTGIFAPGKVSFSSKADLLCVRTKR